MTIDHHRVGILLGESRTPDQLAHDLGAGERWPTRAGERSGHRPQEGPPLGRPPRGPDASQYLDPRAPLHLREPPLRPPHGGACPFHVGAGTFDVQRPGAIGEERDLYGLTAPDQGRVLHAPGRPYRST